MEAIPSIHLKIVKFALFLRTAACLPDYSKISLAWASKEVWIVEVHNLGVERAQAGHKIRRENHHPARYTSFVAFISIFPLLTASQAFFTLCTFKWPYQCQGDNRKLPKESQANFTLFQHEVQDLWPWVVHKCRKWSFVIWAVGQWEFCNCRHWSGLDLRWTL